MTAALLAGYACCLLFALTAHKDPDLGPLGNTVLAVGVYGWIPLGLWLLAS